MDILEKFSKFLNELNLFLVPLYFIQNNTCSCKKGALCKSPGKHPKSISWKVQSQEKYEKEKTLGLVNHKDNDINILKYLYDCAIGNCNLAITTGKYSRETKKYLIVVDVDTAKTKDELVKKNLEILCNNLSKKTFHYRTGSGGYHFWVWSNKLIKNSTSKFYDNVDIRGENGYVVIPPSNHISGGTYDLLSEESIDLGIGDIKDFYDIINEIIKLDGQERIKEIKLNPRKMTAAKSSEEIEENENRREEDSEEQSPEQIRISGEIKAALLNKGKSADEIRYWSSRDIKKVKEDLRLGRKKVPEGIRNSLIYRLLSSDHHLGASKNDLMNNVRFYHNCCEDKHTVLFQEISEMVERISKYKIFRNDRDVNYDFYLMTQETSIYPFSEEDYRLMVKLDNHFFSALEVSEESCKLTDLMKSRTRNMRLFTRRFAEYNQACFAHQLKKRGFLKTRRGGKCTWNIKFNFNKFIQGNPFLENQETKKEVISGVSKKVFNREVWHSEKKLNNRKTNDSVDLFAPHEETRVFNMTIQNKEVTIKVKNKKHPSAIRYPGRSNYEVKKTFTPFLTNLSDEDLEKFENLELFLEESNAREEFAEVLLGDKIGYLAKYDNGMVTSIGEVLEIKKNSFILKDSYNKEELELGFAEASIGRVLGYFEILYRDDKPYGIPEEEEVTVNVEWDDGEPAEQAPENPQEESTDVPDTPAGNPLGSLAEKAGEPGGGVLAASKEHIKTKKTRVKKKVNE